MIRINLLESERETKKKKAGAPGAAQVYAILGGSLAAAAVICGLGYWMKSTTLAGLDAEIAAQQQRKTQLEAVAKQVATFKAKAEILQKKKDLITRLRTERTTAVRLIDEVSKALPEFVWLENLTQAGNQLTFAGKSSNLDAVADFMTNLQTSTHPAGEDGVAKECDSADPGKRAACWFPTVDLRDTTEANRIITFGLAANLQAPAPETGEQAAPAPAGRR